MVDLIQRSIGPVKDIASKIANVQRALTGFQRIDDFIRPTSNRDLIPVAIINRLSSSLKTFIAVSPTFAIQKRKIKELLPSLRLSLKPSQVIYSVLWGFQAQVNQPYSI